MPASGHPNPGPALAERPVGAAFRANVAADVPEVECQVRKGPSDINFKTRQHSLPARCVM
eukprot:5007386-Alexandrium_andersonii.AAC.1